MLSGIGWFRFVLIQPVLVVFIISTLGVPRTSDVLRRLRPSASPGLVGFKKFASWKRRPKGDIEICSRHVVDGCMSKKISAPWNFECILLFYKVMYIMICDTPFI